MNRNHPEGTRWRRLMWSAWFIAKHPCGKFFLIFQTLVIAQNDRRQTRQFEERRKSSAPAGRRLALGVEAPRLPLFSFSVFWPNGKLKAQQVWPSPPSPLSPPFGGTMTAWFPPLPLLGEGARGWGPGLRCEFFRLAIFHPQKVPQKKQGIRGWITHRRTQPKVKVVSLLVG